MSEREVYWGGLIERQAQSGLSVAEFCQRQGLASPSFYVWRKRRREQSHRHSSWRQFPRRAARRD